MTNQQVRGLRGVSVIAFCLASIVLVCADHAATPAARAASPVPAAPTVPAPAPAPYTLGEVLDALRLVETGGMKAEGRHAIGDGGRAIGPYQIHRGYWADAKLGGAHEDCRDPAYARRVVVSYWKRFAPDALARVDAETLARVHNGGPDGFRQDCTLGFWKKVQRQMNATRAQHALEDVRDAPSPVLPAAKKAKSPAPALRPASKGRAPTLCA